MNRSTHTLAAGFATAIALSCLAASAADTLLILDTFDGMNQSDARNGWSETGRQSGTLSPSGYTGSDVGSITGNQLVVSSANGATHLNADLKASLQQSQILGFTLSTKASITAGEWLSFYLTTHSGDERATSRIGFLVRPSGDMTIYSGDSAARVNTAVGKAALATTLGTLFSSTMHLYELRATKTSSTTGTFGLFIDGIAIPEVQGFSYHLGNGNDTSGLSGRYNLAIIALGSGLSATMDDWRATVTDDGTPPPDTPPVILSRTPADNASDVSVSGLLSATFNEPVVLTGTGRITLRDLGPGPDIVLDLPDPQVTISGGNTLVINPDDNLQPNNGYSVLISADSIADLGDPPNAFAGIADESMWDFSTGGPPPVGPNVIVFLVDDLGLTDVQQHPTYFPDGSTLFETPNMHRLADEGMRFRNVYAQPLCSASRASLLSGQHTPARDGLYLAIVNESVAIPSLPTSSTSSRPYNHPTDRNHLPLAVETIAERMKAAGYATWHAGKWHLSPASANTAYYPDKQGFDKQLSVGGSGPPSYFGPFSNIPSMVNHLGQPDVGTNRDHIAEHMAKLVQNTIDHHLATDPARPFFLYYPTYSVHAPHQVRKSLFNYYQTKLAELPDSKQRHPVMAAQVHMADQELGAMLDFLETRNLDENTLFIFLSDNGGLSNEQFSGELFDDIGTDGIPDHLPENTINGNYAKSTAPIPNTTRMTEMAPRKAGKGSLFDGGLRVPMIVRYPNGGIPAGANSDEPVHITDLYPTILEYTPATAKPGYPLDGTSLQPVLDQSGPLPERDLHIYFPRSSETWGFWYIAKGYPGTEDEPFDTYPGGTAVIRHPFKMIARYSTAHDAATVDYQLFRLDLDEGETTNVAGLYPEVVDDMRRSMGAFLQETNAIVPTKNPSYDGTSRNLPEITAVNYFVQNGLTPDTPDTFLLADPDGDGRRNEEEFLQQTDPATGDTPVATTWLYDNGSFLEPRFAFPANVLQSTFEVLDADGNVLFTPTSGLTLDGQYGPFYVYRPTQTQAGENPAELQMSVVRPVPGPSTPPVFAPGDFPRLTISGDINTLGFNLKGQIGYRLFKSPNLVDWSLWEDFAAISGDHDVSLPLNPSKDREFYKLEAYQP